MAGHKVDTREAFRLHDTQKRIRSKSIVASSEQPKMGFFAKVLCALHHETLVAETILRANIPYIWTRFFSYLLPPLFFTPVSLASGFDLIVKTIILSTAHLYAFELVNQTMGVNEDTANKSYRPIPSGLITMRGAEVRGMLAWLLYVLLSYKLSGVKGVKWSFLWLMWALFDYVWPAPNSAILKNVFTGGATFIIQGVVDALIVARYPQHEAGLLFPACLSTWITLVVHLQDFHDMERDAKVGRRTLPLIFKDGQNTLLRKTTCVVFFTIHTAWLGWGMMLATDSDYSCAIYVIGALQLIAGISLGIRVLRAKSASQDKANYYFGLVALSGLMIIYVTILRNVG